MRARDDPATVAWPPFLSADSSVRHVLDGLAMTERLPAEALLLGQSSQLTRLLRWAGRHSPFYQRAGWLGDIFRDLNRRPEAFWDIWRRIPILAKADLRAHGERINADTIPKNKLPIEVNHSSGSTGIVVEVRTTAITRTVWNALTVREHLWRKRDFSKRMGVIRYRPAGDRDPSGRDVPSWGSPVEDVFRTGPASYIHIGHSIDVLAEWLGRVDPHYLLAYPSIAQSILERVGRSSSRHLCLEEIRLIAEPIDPELERYLVDCHHLRVAEIYSANEVGLVAFRCELGALHIQSESVLVEILDDRWRPCAPGETGHLVLTPLHNLATPLIRYDLGDFAVAGGACACGRGLPIIAQVRGRSRNLVRRPDGRHFWPVELGKIRSVRAIRQAQFIQSSIDTIELNFVSDRALNTAEEGQAAAAIRSALDYPFKVEFVRVNEIPRGPTGKFEEFMSRLADTSIVPTT